MFSSDAVAYIPLFGVAIVCAALFVLLGIVKTRKTAKVTSLIFLSLLVLITGCVYTALHPGMMRFVLLLLLASVIVLPYVIMLAFGLPKASMIT